MGDDILSHWHEQAYVIDGRTSFEGRFAEPLPEVVLIDDWFGMVQVCSILFWSVSKEGEGKGGGERKEEG